MSQASSDATNAPKIPDFLIRAAVAGQLHPVVLQYLARNVNLSALSEQELTARLDPWCKVSQVLTSGPGKSTSLGDPMLVPTLAGFVGVERAEEFLRFARILQQKVPDIDNHLRLLATFRSFADAAAKDRAERRAEDSSLPPVREHEARAPSRPPIAPPATQPAASNSNQQLPPRPVITAPPRGPAAPKLWPGHTYVVRRRSAGSE